MSTTSPFFAIMQAVRIASRRSTMVITFFICCGLSPASMSLMMSCGNRDKGKRPLMAQEAVKQSDRVIITSDNVHVGTGEELLNHAPQRAATIVRTRNKGNVGKAATATLMRQIALLLQRLKRGGNRIDVGARLGIARHHIARSARSIQFPNEGQHLFFFCCEFFHLLKCFSARHG